MSTSVFAQLYVGVSGDYNFYETDKMKSLSAVSKGPGFGLSLKMLRKEFELEVSVQRSKSSLETIHDNQAVELISEQTNFNLHGHIYFGDHIFGRIGYGFILVKQGLEEKLSRDFVNSFRSTYGLFESESDSGLVIGLGYKFNSYSKYIWTGIAEQGAYSDLEAKYFSIRLQLKMQVTLY